MAKYKLQITDENEDILKKVSEATGTSTSDLLEEFVNNSINNGLVDLLVQEYRNGKIKAMKAWKLSGLTFEEFNALAAKE